MNETTLDLYTKPEHYNCLVFFLFFSFLFPRDREVGDVEHFERKQKIEIKFDSGDIWRSSDWVAHTHTHIYFVHFTHDQNHFVGFLQMCSLHLGEGGVAGINETAIGGWGGACNVFCSFSSLKRGKPKFGNIDIYLYYLGGGVSLIATTIENSAGISSTVAKHFVRNEGGGRGPKQHAQLTRTILKFFFLIFSFDRVITLWSFDYIENRRNIMEMVKIFFVAIEVTSIFWFSFHGIFCLLEISSKFKSTGTSFWFSWRHMSVIIDYLHRGNVNWNRHTHTSLLLPFLVFNVVHIYNDFFHFWWPTYCYQQSIAREIKSTNG